MKYNLQFFADEDVSIDTGAEAQEVTDPVEVEGTTDNPEVSNPEPTEVAQEEKPSVDVNAIAASIRRKAEADAKRKQEENDAEFVRRFGSYKNPITGQPIRSQADYFAALDAQEKVRAENELRQKGVDPAIIQQMVDNSPAVRQANAYMQKVQADEVQRRINEDVAEITKLNPSIDSLEKVPKEVVEMCANIKGLSLVQAYKIANYGNASSTQADAIRQQTVNQIKGKSHMTPMTGVASNETEVEIPANQRAIWEEMFPNKTYAERRKLYNKNL